MEKPAKSQALSRLKRALEAIPHLQALKYDSSEFEKWHRNTEVAIEYTFGQKSRHVRDFQRIVYSPMIVTADTSSSSFQHCYASGLTSASSVLQSMIEEVEEYWRDDSSPAESTAKQDRSADGVKVFVIHGHDDGSKETVARFITKLGLTPVILHEQPNRGRTIIEKFETHADTAYAIALLTPDDVGGQAGPNPEQRPRARQNVIFEFGFFMGKLGRDRVCGLTKGEVELPSDYSGVLYIPIDPSGAWKITLVRELKAVGIDVDANLAI